MKPGMLWPAGVTAILGATVAANLWVMRLANADLAFSVEPDYYRKAVNYDSTMAQARTNVALGWTVSTAVAPIVPGEKTRIQLALRDANGVALTGARVAVMARFVARGNDTVTAVLRESTAGEYTALLPLGRIGAWDLRVDASRERDRFSITQRLWAIARD
jgi:nitrogen fixation protein FixH